MPLSEDPRDYPLEYFRAWERATQERFQVECSSHSEATYIKQRLYALRKALRRNPDGNERLVNMLDSVGIQQTGSLLTIGPRTGMEQHGLNSLRTALANLPQDTTTDERDDPTSAPSPETDASSVSRNDLSRKPER